MIWAGFFFAFWLSFLLLLISFISFQLHHRQVSHRLPSISLQLGLVAPHHPSLLFLLLFFTLFFSLLPWILFLLKFLCFLIRFSLGIFIFLCPLYSCLWGKICCKYTQSMEKRQFPHWLALTRLRTLDILRTRAASYSLFPRGRSLPCPQPLFLFCALVAIELPN